MKMDEKSWFSVVSGKSVNLDNLSNDDLVRELIAEREYNLKSDDDFGKVRFQEKNAESLEVKSLLNCKNNYLIQKILDNNCCEVYIYRQVLLHISVNILTKSRLRSLVIMISLV